jgi:exodeoxyribonuclease VII small subunit
MGKKKTRSFEDSLKRLQEISEKLEDEELGLEDSIKLYEEGIELTKDCYSTLSNAELKVTELKKQLEAIFDEDEKDEE